MVVTPIKTRLFEPREDLVDFIIEHLPRPAEGDVVVVTSKIVALAQGRIIDLLKTDAKNRAIKRESSKQLRTPWCWVTYKNGEWCANAGVDESNANDELILMPTKIQETAEALLKTLKRRYKRKQLGLLITDTRIYPMRVGTMGVVVGFAGIEGIKSYIGSPDLFGRKLKMTQANIVHALAVSAVLTMGEGRERQPLALIHDAPVMFTNKRTSVASLTIDPKDDLYREVYLASAPSSRRPATRRRSR
ncbi:MAG: coenzyme F420-0:L-glutamate ligase [Patescibacteria group bacterium]